MSYGISSALFSPMESKSVRGGTKRRAVSLIPQSATQLLSRRVTKLAKSLKASNPQHVLVWNAAATWTPVSTTGTLIDLCSNIVQGDDFNQRFGSHVDVTHINLKLFFNAGANSVLPNIIRLTIFTGEAGLGFTANLGNTYNPIADNATVRLIWDKFLAISSNVANPTFPCVIEKSLKVRHRQKFTGAGANATGGNTLYFVIQSGIASGGGLSPVLDNGFVEVYFKP